MIDQLGDLFLTTPARPAIEMVARLLLAAVLGAIVAWIYRRTRKADADMQSFPGTLVLLSVLIALVTLVIGDSVARAFSLVGALSIVRFRTSVRDTLDTAFVVFAVVAGMAAGAASFWVAVIGVAIVGCAAFLVPDAGASASPEVRFTVRLRVALAQDLQALARAFEPFVATRDLRGLATARQGLSLDVIYDVAFRAERSPDELLRALNRIEGVQDVDVRRVDAEDGT